MYFIIYLDRKRPIMLQSSQKMNKFSRIFILIWSRILRTLNLQHFFKPIILAKHFPASIKIKVINYCQCPISKQLNYGYGIRLNQKGMRKYQDFIGCTKNRKGLYPQQSFFFQFSILETSTIYKFLKVSSFRYRSSTRTLKMLDAKNTHLLN